MFYQKVNISLISLFFYKLFHIVSIIFLNGNRNKDNYTRELEKKYLPIIKPNVGSFIKINFKIL